MSGPIGLLPAMDAEIVDYMRRGGSHFDQAPYALVHPVRGKPSRKSSTAKEREQAFASAINAHFA